jgi:hypothetical protein
MANVAVHPPDSVPGAADPPPSRWIVRMLKHTVLVLTLRCERADLIRTRSRHGEAHWSERLAERLHRLICHTCRRNRKQSAFVDAGLCSFAERELRG